VQSLKETVKNLKLSGRKGLSFFLTAGYPSMKEFKELLFFIDREKLADFLEIGVPFSDPLADGSVIQQASVKAIERGVKLRNIFREIKSLKNNISTPLIIMSYMNPLYSGGFAENIRKAEAAGFQAAIIPDLPAGEADDLTAGFNFVYLAAPSTSEKRLAEISEKSSPFLYYVSSYGVTGERDRFSKTVAEKLKDAKKISKVPVYCGFGISNPEQAALISASADGIIIGSALVKLINGSPSRYFKQIKKFAISIKQAL